MGMSIDEAIKILEHYNHGFCETSGGLSEPIKVAIETMRKYQQTEQIFKTWYEVGHDGDISAFRDLRKVIEDGNDD